MPCLLFERIPFDVSALCITCEVYLQKIDGKQVLWFSSIYQRVCNVIPFIKVYDERLYDELSVNMRTIYTVWLLLVMCFNIAESWQKHKQSDWWAQCFMIRVRMSEKVSDVCIYCGSLSLHLSTELNRVNVCSRLFLFIILVNLPNIWGGGH